MWSEVSVSSVENGQLRLQLYIFLKLTFTSNILSLALIKTLATGGSSSVR